ncbi:PX-domain-containing protein [Backusella circina FSU 941]|nr:PX-domain-containing protein [Backusella circina FSU 941]
MSQRNSFTKSSCGCSIERLIHREDAYIFITGAQKQSDSPAGKSYIAYHIRIGDTETRRRYSEFESFRKALTSLHPALIVPPIPEKHSLVDYATLQSRVKDDLPMVEKRKRMLQTFLNRVAKHPELSQDHVFHRFLESGVVWADVLHSPPLSTLPKNPLQMVLSKQPNVPAYTYNATLSSNLIPTPSAAYQLKQPDPRFEESEKFTFRIANYMSNNLDKSQRKVIRRLGELANDYAELGAVYNGFSLNETGAVANAIEKVGQAVDAAYTETGQMVTSLEGEFAEPIQEHAQFAQIIKQVLKFRHMKHAQVEMIETSLNNKKENLESLLRMENEARRLEEAITRERTIGSNAINVDELNEQDEQVEQEENPYHTATTTTTARPVNNNSWTGTPMRVISAVGHTLQNIIDVNPEATRRNQIGMSKDAMGVLQEALDITKNDLGTISTELQTDLDRFQTEKIQDMRDMLIAYAKIHIRYCQKNLESWQEARAEVEKIPI